MGPISATVIHPMADGLMMLLPLESPCYQRSHDASAVPETMPQVPEVGKVVGRFYGKRVRPRV